MKMNDAPVATRRYRQRARAAAAEASSKRILEAFLKKAETEWFEDIRLDALAQDAGVTVQTVIRKYGGKAGILEAAAGHLGELVTVRRTAKTGDVNRLVDALAVDYEASGKLVVRLLSQEERQPVLRPFLERGRRFHRDWLSTAFAGVLEPLTPARRTIALDSLVVATDVYVWKLVRMDVGRPVAAYKTLVKRMVKAVLRGE